MTPPMKLAKWYELRIPMHVFLPIVFFQMAQTGYKFFIYNLATQIRNYFQASDDMMAWSEGAFYLIGATSQLLIPIWRTRMKTENLIRVFYAFIVVVGFCVFLQMEGKLHE